MPETPPPGGGTGEAGGSPQAKPTKFNELAGRLNVELDDLYALELATAADGKPVTVQQLKDEYANRAEHSVAQLQWEERRAEQQAELVRANGELRELIAALPREAIDKQVLERVRAKHEANVNRENARTLEVIPEWRDEAKRTEELAGMAEHLKRYGFPAEYLAGVTDHRVRLMIRDAWRREQRVKAALAAVESSGPATPPKSRANDGKPPSVPPKTSRSNHRGRAGLLALLQE